MALRLSSGALRSESEIIFSLHVSRRPVSAGLATSRQDSIGIKEGKKEANSLFLGLCHCSQTKLQLGVEIYYYFLSITLTI